MKFPLTQKLVEEARQFQLRSSCGHCYYWRGDSCLHGWPDEGQRRWPIDAADPTTGERPVEVAFCKEFELR